MDRCRLLRPTPRKRTPRPTRQNINDQYNSHAHFRLILLRALREVRRRQMTLSDPQAHAIAAASIALHHERIATAECERLGQRLATREARRRLADADALLARTIAEAIGDGD